ncbi:MAG: transcriptional regulator [Brachymonas sp.]|nr:transcriptional regulator [Brachymonas sp.]
MQALFFKQNRPLAGMKCARSAIDLAAFKTAFNLQALTLTAALLITPIAFAQKPGEPAPTGQGAISVSEWLSRMHEAAMKKRSYIGTLVQSSGGAHNAISSARIWHACDGQNQVERVEALTGAPRSSIRKDDKLVTFVPEAKLVRMETREGIAASGNFTDLLKPGDNSIAEFYLAKSLGTERIAGHEADVVQLQPRDALRYGYRLWTERKTALVLKIQTLDSAGAVLEQAAFSELQLDAPVKMNKLKAMMKPQEGWRVEHSDVIKTTASAEGWQLKASVPGFKGVSCHKRGASTQAAQDDTLQWVFSDGLATVSLFVQPFDKSRHTQEGIAATGATNSLFRRLNEHFLTVVGEVPPQTLRQFAAALERKK